MDSDQENPDVEHAPWMTPEQLYRHDQRLMDWQKRMREMDERVRKTREQMGERFQAAFEGVYAYEKGDVVVIDDEVYSVDKTS